MNTQVFPQLSGSQEKIKSYWNRPGGKFGTFAAIAALGAIGYFLMPIINKIIWGWVEFGIAAAIAFALFLLLSNRKFWLGIGYFWEILINKMISGIIEMNPFIIAEDYIRDIENERNNLYEKSVEVDAQKEALELKIKEKEKEKKKQLDMAVAAQQTNQPMEMANCTRQAARLDAFILQLAPIRDNLHRIGEYLTAVHKNSKYMLDDMKNDLELKKDLYNSVTKGNNALKSAMSIFSGDVEKRLMVEQSMNYLKDDIAGKLASMKKAISYSSDFMKSIDLESASMQADGLRMLEEYKPELFAHIESQNQMAPTTVSATRYDSLIR